MCIYIYIFAYIIIYQAYFDLTSSSYIYIYISNITSPFFDQTPPCPAL